MSSEPLFTETRDERETRRPRGETFLSIDCSAVAFARMEAVRLRARDAVQKALRAGKITRPSSCQRCGASRKLESHHADYFRVLDVEWLCTPCHKQETRRIIEEARQSIERYRGVPLWMQYAKKAAASGTTAQTVYPARAWGRDDD